MWEFIVVIVIGAVTSVTITDSSGILTKEKREPGIIWKMF
jgi:hypothetical protein